MVLKLNVHPPPLPFPSLPPSLPQDYGDGTMSNAAALESYFAEFFLNVKAFLRKYVLPPSLPPFLPPSLLPPFLPPSFLPSLPPSFRQSSPCMSPPLHALGRGYVG